ncbi:MAG: hypothetical protein KGJ55_00180 [Gammaproteobacteria bacterium]|nr:hypothetical protein [Gammaproteobacteria bacterium]
MTSAMADVVGKSGAGGGPSRERTAAGSRFNRRPVLPPVLAIHRSIGMAYGFSVFRMPMLRLVVNPRQLRLEHGVARNLVCGRTLYILAGLLFVSLIRGLLIRAVQEAHGVDEEEVEAEPRFQRQPSRIPASAAAAAARGVFGIGAVLALRARGRTA